MDIIDILQSRYAAKEFEPTLSISPEQLDKLKMLLRLAPSSTNIQPWHFIVAHSEAAKARVANSTQGFFIFNERKVLDSAAVVIFSTKVAANDGYFEHLSTTEQDDGRFATPEFRAHNHAGRVAFDAMHRYDFKDEQHWFDKQTYLNLGNFLLGVAAMGLDAVPMEGFDAKILGEEFGLVERGFTPSVLVAVGYSSVGDFNADLPKSRLPLEEIVEVL